MTPEGKKKGTVLMEFVSGTRSELETAPHQPLEVSGRIWGVIHSLNRDILENF